MKNIYVYLVFFSLLLASCAGTKYKNTNSTTINTPIKNTNKTVKKDKEQRGDLDVENQEDVDFALDYKITEDNSDFFSLTEQVILTAMDNLGVRYRAGGTTKSGFDCSGLVYTSFKKYDISLPRSSHDMAEFGQKIKDSEVKRGDLIFFITNGGRRINHVGIVTEVFDDEIKFVHSSTKLGVIISSTKEPYYKKNYVKVARVL